LTLAHDENEMLDENEFLQYTTYGVCVAKDCFKHVDFCEIMMKAKSRGLYYTLGVNV
jgi:hypothetical protein